MEPKTVGRERIQKDAKAQSPFSMSGLVAGTLVLTGDGQLPIEFLSPEDRIISRTRGMVRLVGIEARTETVQVVRIAPGTLGPFLPKHTTMMSASQKLLLRGAKAQAVADKNQIICPVQDLIDGESIVDLGTRELRLVRLIFDKPEVIYADGIEVAITTPAGHILKAA